MFIPVGLIGSLLVQQREHEQAAAMHQAAMWHEHQKHGERVSETWYACTGPTACMLVLGSVDWASTAVDQAACGGQLATQPMGGWRDCGDGLGPGPHGFLAICPGLHTVSTNVMGRPISATLLLFPREAYFLRFDWQAYAWRRFANAEERAILERAGRSDLALFDYAQTIVPRRMGGYAVRSSKEALEDALRLVKEAIHALALGDPGRARHRAENAVTQLVGAPLTTFEPITSLIGFHAFELAGKGRFREAHAVTELGLAMLPDHPTLLGVLGELFLREGKRAEGVPHLERALAREAGLDDRLQLRVRELLGSTP
jgi:hypothetical protein